MPRSTDEPRLIEKTRLKGERNALDQVNQNHPQAFEFIVAETGGGAPYGSRTRLCNVKGCRPNR